MRLGHVKAAKKSKIIQGQDCVYRTIGGEVREVTTVSMISAADSACSIAQPMHCKILSANTGSVRVYINRSAYLERS